ncbi:MAG: SDR family oxidoreductase [Pseudomonadota bacterium]|nr:SDR family oxidoreductase [Pseudomonadota bacterium]
MDGQIALVTGVSNDGQIGQSVAQIFAYNGAGIGIAARSQKNVEARAKELEAEGAKALALPVDLADETQVGQAVERMIAHYGRIHILVNLAGGLTRYKAAVDHTLDDWNAELNNNLLTAFLCSRAVFPHMRKSGGGCIINFSRAGRPQANMVAYNCAKAAIEALTQTLALEGRDAKIRVNAVALGLVDTASNLAAMKPKDLTKWAKRDDVAQAVLFLASDAAHGVTGQILPVAGWGI